MKINVSKSIKFFIIIGFLGLVSYIVSSKSNNRVDITIVGPFQKADGLGRVTAEFIELIHDKKRWNFYKSSKLDFKDIKNSEIKQCLKTKTSKFGKVILVTEPIFQNDIYRRDLFAKIHKKANHYKPRPFNIQGSKQSLMIALSMFESDRLPQEWVNRLNTYFDAVIVPDDYLVGVYTNSGVGIPIFVCPIALDLKTIYETNPNLKNTKKFVFGFMGSATSRKNVLELIQCFHNVFKNNPNVELKINCRYADSDYYASILELLNTIHANNIFFSTASFNEQEYIDFMSQLNCLVNISKGEGYSIQPREALAMGIPCILTNNTAQSKFKDNKHVLSIPCNKKVPYLFAGLKENTGSQFAFDFVELEKAFEEMYSNYARYIGKEADMFKSVQDSDIDNVLGKYLQIASPKFRRGENNKITEEYIETNNLFLLKKAERLGLFNE